MASKNTNVEEVVSMPVATDRSALAIAEILAQVANTMAEKKVLGLTINGQPVNLDGNLNIDLKLDDKTLAYRDGKLSVCKGVFYSVID